MNINKHMEDQSRYHEKRTHYDEKARQKIYSFLLWLTYRIPSKLNGCSFLTNFNPTEYDIHNLIITKTCKPNISDQNGQLEISGQHMTRKYIENTSDENQRTYLT